MSGLTHKLITGARRINRVRKTVSGTAERPRLAVKVSNLHMTAQLIDDDTGRTLAYATSVGKKLTGNKTEIGQLVGSDLAGKAKKAKVTKVVFDRRSKLYHGRIKALAEAARAGGLEF